jgi:hypothetical protein
VPEGGRSRARRILRTCAEVTTHPTGVLC